MTLSELNDYDNKWVGQSPKDILFWVKQRGGWKAVFPGDLPLWAHRVRNFFNQEPMTLTRYAKDFADVFLANIIDHARTTGGIEGIKQRSALTEYVYGDEHKRLWYQMNSASTIYHFGPPPFSATMKAIRYGYAQSWTPVFKLMSLDGTGGSMETIIENPIDLEAMKAAARTGGIPRGPRRSNIGEVNKLELVAHRIVTAPWHRGSYNYSETVEVGFAAHDKHDIKPDNLYPTAHVNPPNRHMPLALRRFPKL